MAGLNHIREAYEQVYAQLDERMDPEEMALRRAEIADKKASRMDPKVASKYADSEARSAATADKRSRGKHIHGMADSYEVDGDLVDEGAAADVAARAATLARQRKGQTPERKAIYKNLATQAGERANPSPSGRDLNNRTGMTADFRRSRRGQSDWNIEHDKPGGITKNPKKLRKQKALGEIGEAKDDSYLETDMNKRQQNNEKAIQDMKKTKAHADMVKAARKHFDEETLAERQLDAAETGEKERLVKGLKKSAIDFKKRYGDRWKSVMYATATSNAKRNMDTSRSDRRYSVER